MTAQRRAFSRGRLGPYTRRSGWVRGVTISLFAALFLALSGAFGSGDAPLSRRLVYWVPLMLVGWIWGSFVAGLFRFGYGERRRIWLRVVGASLAMALPFTLVVAAFSSLLYGAQVGLEDAPGLLLAVTSVALVMTSLNVLTEQRLVTEAAPPAAAPPRFLERLPLKLRGAEVWAVEAEDHYLRLHTSRGQDLILMRLSDAVAELEGIEGAQVHRSWWVARAAITDARRSDGRATLTLKDGSEVPVSRTYARILRERSWI
ncbi:LytTR family DNA-binding domain-containing protein [Phenylobacterium deserti]|uniref:HTH LytTR-type domain-containing protein n=1 Tax=Phenylobacterium deserti TaxID=1914756 RepID=A0A328AR04_9CAUL|nr:LytTR family DNA-binding domain-containing protein [Phenylobacterium deserti]RAK57450.1 hypothetical protein DJ018_05785 [Phenylobacterium deserti]